MKIHSKRVYFQGCNLLTHCFKEVDESLEEPLLDKNTLETSGDLASSPPETGGVLTSFPPETSVDSFKYQPPTVINKQSSYSEIFL